MMLARLKDLLRLSGGEWLVSFTTRENPERLFAAMQEQPVRIDIRKAAKRTKTANDFCWAMCTDIGNALKPPVPKEFIYRKTIKDVGKCILLLIKAERTDEFIKMWGMRGTGWFCEVVDDSHKNPGCKVIKAYYGTSVYTGEEMGRLLDYLVQDMQNMELPIPLSKREQKEVIKRWDA